MKAPFLLAAAMLASASAPALAQTKEEAVAYAFLGLADEATLTRGKTTMSWRENASSPATFEGDAIIGGKRTKLRFTVSATDACDYEIVLEGPPNIVPGTKRLFARIDLRKVTAIGITADGFKATVGGHGLCETGSRNPTCMEVDTFDLFGSVDPKKHGDTVAFIRDSVCAAKQ
jgi:hypothetical protein